MISQAKIRIDQVIEVSKETHTKASRSYGGAFFHRIEGNRYFIKAANPTGVYLINESLDL